MHLGRAHASAVPPQTLPGLTHLWRELAWTGLLLSSLAPPRALSVLLADERARVLAEAIPPEFA